MTFTRKHLIAGASVLAIAAAGGGIAYGVAGDDEDETVTGPGADRAKAAALEITGGGRANSVERDSEDGATWEVEVTKPGGETVDVRLDERYRRVVVEGDVEDADSSGEE